MKRVILAPAARLDMLEAADFLSENSSVAARRFRIDVGRSLARISQFPSIAPLARGARREGLRQMTVRHWLILNVEKDEVVEVLRVVGGSREIENLAPWRRE